MPSGWLIIHLSAILYRYYLDRGGLSKREHIAEEKPERRATARTPLVIVVDLDNDIGEVLGRNVIRGYDDVLRASVSYALARPEDADVNAMFEGLRLYRLLERERGKAEIAVVGGDSLRPLEAQKKIKERVKEIVEDLGPAELFIVSDGEDEIIATNVLVDVAPIGGVKRVVVEQHLGIESSYLLIARYLRKALGEPRFAKYTLGIPGLVLTVGALLSLAGLIDVAIKLAAVIVGVALMVYGFGLEDALSRFLKGLSGELRDIPHLKIAGLSIFLLTLVVAVGLVYEAYTASGIEGALSMLFKYSLPLSLLGASIYLLISGVIASAARGKVDISKYAAFMVMLGFASLAFYSLGDTMSRALQGGDVAVAFLVALIESKFLQYMLVGAGLAGLIELLSRAIK